MQSSAVSGELQQICPNFFRTLSDIFFSNCIISFVSGSCPFCASAAIVWIIAPMFLREVHLSPVLDSRVSMALIKANVSSMRFADVAAARLVLRSKAA